MEKIVTDTTKSSLNNFAGTKTLATLAYPADTPLTMSSREIAELVEARHNDVIATIERLFGKGLLRSSRKTRRESTGGRPIDVYDLVERDTYLVVAGYSDEYRAKVVDRWQELEVKASRPVQPTVALPHDYISALEHLLESKKAEQLAIAQRDEAIRTKAQIGSTREATAMATAASAKKEAEALKARLGESVKSATVKAVESLTKSKFKWKPLKDWCDKNAAPIGKVLDEQYGSVNSYPAEAWQAVHDIHLKTLFSKAFA